MSNCNFEAINKVLNKRMKKIRNGIFDQLSFSLCSCALHRTYEKACYVTFML